MPSHMFLFQLSIDVLLLKCGICLLSLGSKRPVIMAEVMLCGIRGEARKGTGASAWSWGAPSQNLLPCREGAQRPSVQPCVGATAPVPAEIPANG